MATVVGTQARSKVFKPDKSILLSSGYPAHAGLVEALDTEAVGHAGGTRLRGARVTAMLTVILDDLHAQQPGLKDFVDAPAEVYWLIPAALVEGGESDSTIFATAWACSAWRGAGYRLRLIPHGDVHTVLDKLQSGIDHSAIRFTIIVAADSLLDRDELAPALALGHIFSSTTPQGFIPSEAAGGVLLINPTNTAVEQWENSAILGPVANAEGPGSGHLRNVMSGALTISGVDADDVGFVISDSDHRANGSIQVMDAMRHVIAGLDPLEERISPMEYAGSFGVAASLVNLALALELASDKPVLAVSSSGNRCASIMVMPA